jgi:CRP-like cAMP-binding protein
MAFLIQVNEGVKSVVLPLGKAVILIGRDTDSNLYLDDSGISKNHASIVFSNETYTLKDNGSASGSIVNGARVREHNLAHDDIIQFGPYSFKVDLKNPFPVTTAVEENDVQLQRSGHSYTRRVQLAEIAGLEKSGSLHVVMTDTPKTLPLPLPPTGFLSNLSVQERQNLSLRGTYRYARTGEVLIKEGQDAGRLLLVISGKWEARKEASQTVLGQIQPGEWVGEVNIFDPAGAVCSVVAVQPSEYWEITREAFEKFINDSRGTGSAILIALAATLGRRIRQSTEGLQQAIDSRPEPLPPKRSIFTPIFAAVAVVAVIAAVAFFFTGTADKNRLEAEKEKIVQSRAETLEEANLRVDALQASLNTAQDQLKRALAEKQSLVINLQSVTTQLRNAKQSATQAAVKTAAPASSVEPEAAPVTDAAHDEILAKAAKLSGFPSEVVITQKTNVELIVDGKVSGSAVLPEGRELPVVGAEGDDVIIVFGSARQRIPKANTNFAEALVAEAEASKTKPVPVEKIAKVEPKPTPTPIKMQEASKSLGASDKKPENSSMKSLEALVDDVKLLDTIDALNNLRGASHSELSRYIRSIDVKWKRASEDSAKILSDGSLKPEYSNLLKKFIEAAEMLDPNRVQRFQTKLLEIDKDWLELKTQEKIQSITESQHE